MTTSLPGAPVGREQAERTSLARVFARPPKLRDLLQNGGWPGVTYAAVCLHNLKHAADRRERPANLRALRGMEEDFFAIRGPRGVAEMLLVGTGQPIPGAAPDAGERLYFTDGEVEELTGHAVQDPIWFRARRHDGPRQVAESQESDGADQGAQGDARVQGRHTPQRKLPRPARHQPQASHRDRHVGSEKETLDVIRARREKIGRERSERMKEYWRKRKSHEQAEGNGEAS